MRSSTGKQSGKVSATKCAPAAFSLVRAFATRSLRSAAGRVASVARSTPTLLPVSATPIVHMPALRPSSTSATVSPTFSHAPSGPDRLYLIDRQGKVRFKSKPGPFGFHVTDLAQAVKISLPDR